MHRFAVHEIKSEESANSGRSEPLISLRAITSLSFRTRPVVWDGGEESAVPIDLKKADSSRCLSRAVLLPEESVVHFVLAVIANVAARLCEFVAATRRVALTLCDRH